MKEHSADRAASTIRSRLVRLREFWSRVYQESAEDKIFFMAGAISYNLLIAVVPLFLLAVGVWGYVVGALALSNMGLTIFLQSLGGWGTDLLGIPEDLLGSTQRVLATSLALASTWVMFAVVYWYVPVRRISWRTAWIAATVMALSYEVMKLGFGWYVTSVADYRSAYGNLATVVVLLFWIYYVSVGFVLSGEVAQVYTMRKARKMQSQTAFGGLA